MLQRTSRIVIPAALALAALTGAGQSPVPAAALKAITPEGLLRHIRVLSSDEFEGRAPATAGEKKSLDYLIAQAREMKLEPGTPDGGWLQPVALWGITNAGSKITITSGGADFPLADTDYRATSTQPKAVVAIPDSGIVFAGYGIVAPEYQWDDYKGLDVHGKAVVILGGDPPIPDPSDPAKLDPKMFRGDELSWFGRPGSKAEMAYQRGATAVITIMGGAGGRGGNGGGRGANAAGRGGANNAGRGGANGAGRGGNGRGGSGRAVSRETMIVRDDSSTQRIGATIALNGEKTTALFAASGLDLAELRKQALSRDFKPVELKASISGEIHNEVREIETNNVVAKITGSDPVLRNQYVIYTGHWDHMGHIGENIFHGASDNASGTAGVLELAHAFSKLPSHPKRTVLFIWTTAEERGLLGAKYYAQHPLYPLSQTVVNINLDYFSDWGWGRTKDFSVLGTGMTTLDDMVKEAVERQGRVMTGDTDPPEGFYWRSDHVEFATVGVPSLATSPGIDFVGRPAGWGEQKRAEYIRNDYHQVSDQIKPDWDLKGAVEDLQVLLEVGYRCAQEPGRPTWTNKPSWVK